TVLCEEGKKNMMMTFQYFNFVKCSICTMKRQQTFT
ncbi:MAG: hypothetical protein ACI8RD_008704, partial [Bacillariaceae sp.]